MARFVVLMTENAGAWDRLPAPKKERILERYYAWVVALKKKKALAGGEGIGGGGRVLRRSGGRIVEKAFAGKKDVLTGYFLLEAKDLAAAAKLARGCPALSHGETVVVRPAGHP